MGYVNYQNEQTNLMKLFNMIKKRSKNTREWKTALIQPIYKVKRNERDLGNDRGIALPHILG